MFPRRAVMRYLLKNSTSVDPKTKKKMQWLANAPFLAFFFIYLMLWNWSSDDPLWSQHICYFLKGVYAWLIDSEKMKSHQYLLHVSNRVKAGEATSVVSWYCTIWRLGMAYRQRSQWWISACRITSRNFCSLHVLHMYTCCTCEKKTSEVFSGFSYNLYSLVYDLEICQGTDFSLIFLFFFFSCFNFFFSGFNFP